MGLFDAESRPARRWHASTIALTGGAVAVICSVIVDLVQGEPIGQTVGAGAMFFALWAVVLGIVLFVRYRTNNK